MCKSLYYRRCQETFKLQTRGKQMQGLVSTEKSATFADIAAIPVPAAKGRYMPVSNADLSRMVIDSVKSSYSLADDDLDIRFGLSQKDQQMFGSIIVKEQALLDRKFDSSLMFCFRNSYNKSLSIALLSGANCWICDNGQMVGDLIELRKHTLNVWNAVWLKSLGTLVSKVCLCHSKKASFWKKSATQATKNTLYSPRGGSTTLLLKA